MKGIIIRNKIVIKEKSITIDRDRDQFSMDLSCEVRLKVKEALDEKDKKMITQINKAPIDIEKEEWPKLWKLVKDSSQQTHVNQLYNTIEAFYPLAYKAKKAAEETKEEDEVYDWVNREIRDDEGNVKIIRSRELAVPEAVRKYDALNELTDTQLAKDSRYPLSLVEEIFDTLYAQDIKPEEIEFKEL